MQWANILDSVDLIVDAVLQAYASEVHLVGKNNIGAAAPTLAVKHW